MKGNHVMILGGPILNGPKDPRELAQAHLDFGFTAAFCPLIPISETKLIGEYRQAFEDAGIVCAEVGAWRNLLASDEETHRTNFQFVTERLALAEEYGARCCVDFIGTLDPDSQYGPHPGNLTDETFDLTVETVRSVIDEVKPTRTTFCLEMMQWTFPDSADNYLDLLKAIDRPAFAVHLDPVNLIVSPRQYYDTGSIVRECFAKLGKWIVSCHAKDIIIRNKLSLHFDETLPGTGNMDYRTYLAELARLPGDVPIMLEHLATTEEYATARDYLLKVGKALEV